MTLSRRALLRAGLGTGLGVGGAGCAAPVRNDGRTPSAAIVGADDPPPLPVRPSVEVVSATATDAHPPRLRATVTNRSDGTVTVGEGRAVVFAYVADTADELTLLPTDRTYSAAPGCWRLREPVAVTEEYRTVTLAPEEAASRVVGVYGAAGGEGCLPTGTFRFETTYRVTSGADPGSDGGDGATWGFSLRLS